MLLRTFNLQQFKNEYAGELVWQDYAEEMGTVRAIIAEVRKSGDKALLKYTAQFDGVELDDLTVSSEDFEEAVNQVDPALQEAIDKALYNIECFHIQQKRQSFWLTGEGTLLGQVYRPLGRVGVYVPGGTASYPSSVLMTVTPARVAGVQDIIMCTPPDGEGKINPVTLYTAQRAGVKRIYKAGGVQAIAAMAYGTASIPRVDKIAGPGNIFVTLAKKEVFGDVGIDMLAGPSEIMIVAGQGSDPQFIAADLLSQAEHDPLAKAYLVTDSKELALAVEREVEKQLSTLPRSEVAELSLQKQGGIIMTSDLEETWEIVNLVAPEHLEIHLEDSWNYLGKINNAGSIFFGPYTPEAVGDYWAGTNHVLPTGRSARFFSPLGVDDYMKYSQVIAYSPSALKDAAAAVEHLAMVEGLHGHARSVKIRREK